MGHIKNSLRRLIISDTIRRLENVRRLSEIGNGESSNEAEERDRWPRKDLFADVFSTVVDVRGTWNGKRKISRVKGVT